MFSFGSALSHERVNTVTKHKKTDISLISIIWKGKKKEQHFYKWSLSVNIDRQKQTNEYILFKKYDYVLKASS